MNSIISCVSLLLLLGVALSLALQDSTFARHRKPLYIVFNGDTPQKRFLSSTLELQPVYSCTKDVRKKYHPKNENLDFEAFAKRYIDCFAQKILGGKMDWYDLFGEKDELKKQKYNGLHLNLMMNDVKFSKENLVSSNVDISLRNVVYNNDSQTEVTNKVQESVEKVTSITTSSKHTWKTTGTMEVGWTEPITKSSASVKMTAFQGGSSGTDTTESDSTKYFISDASIVPAGKTGRLVWTKTVSSMKMDWNAYIEVSGWMGTKVKGNIYFLPVVDMIYVYDEYMTRLDLNTAGIMTSGQMQMTDAIISDAVADEYDMNKVKTDQDKCPDEFSNILMYPLKKQTNLA
uniref:Scol-BPFTx n=1 Tax=Scolopendra viridis TaxID=118503 RepID=A0A4D5R9P5_SCOVI